MKNPQGESNTSSYFFCRPMPSGLEGLNELALDLRWTWSHFSDRLWEQLDPEAWERTGNPYFILQSVSQARLEEAAQDSLLQNDIRLWGEERTRYLDDPGWFGQTYSTTSLRRVAYFSMEFGMNEALPLYSGGLGILAGDHLKTASDLGVPMVGIGLLYQQGYFRQILNPEAWQVEVFPYNDPMNLPVMPVKDLAGGWLRIKLELPGRTLLVRVWQAQVGKVTLYLLDSNDPLNTPKDRGITAKLYGGGQEQRLLQEVVLGIAGWRILEELQIPVDVCHLNEGHAAFVIFARAKSFMANTGQSFPVALAATRAGNVFTTHTPVEAAFDRFEPSLIRPYAQLLSSLVGVPVDQLLTLGRQHASDGHEPFNMAYLAIRGSGRVNGVSRLHGQVSRNIFQPLFPRWPEEDIPVGHITNGIHTPSWDSQAADTLWTDVCGKDRWVRTLEDLGSLITQVSDETLWTFRMSQRQALIQYVRRRLVRQLQEHGAAQDQLEEARHALDPNALTIGFARRLTAYKRPTLLLTDRDRLIRLLCDQQHPVQLIMAGKAHPHDEEGKRLVQALAQFAAQPTLRNRVVFLEDYEMGLAQELVAGIDVWLNTPRRPLEASGTSGMKVLVNGGLNLSELDGWWAEAYTPEVGWALGTNLPHLDGLSDVEEAAQLYDILENQIIPEFYARDHEAIPRRWIKRVRTSMSQLTPHYSSNRMVREYVENAYLPASNSYQLRAANGGKVAQDIHQWCQSIQAHWTTLRFGDMHVVQIEEDWSFEVQVHCGSLDPAIVNVELYADRHGDDPSHRILLDLKHPVPGLVNAYLYWGKAPALRPADHYTPRIVPAHPDAVVPLECSEIAWMR